jgi:WD40 repeat protein
MSKFSAADIIGTPKSKAPSIKPKKKRLSQIWEADINDYVISMNYSPDEKWIAAAGISGQIFIFEAETGEKHFEITAHSFGAKIVSWSKDGRYFTSAGQDGKIRLFNAGNFVEIKTLLAGANWVESVRWSPHSNTFVSTAGKSIQLWSAQGELLQNYPEQASTVVDVSWSPVSERFITACYGGLTEWQSETSVPVHKYEWKGSSLVIAWSPNGKYIATGDQDSTVHFWITQTGQDLQMYGYPTKVKELSWDSTGQFLATGGGDIVIVWNCEPSPEGTKPIELKGHENFLSFLAFQPRGLLLASGDLDGKLSLWDVGSRGGRFQFAAKLTGEITNISWAKDNKHLAVSDSNGIVKLLSVE